MRYNVEFDSHGTRCAAWLYVPEGEGPFPTLVMAHGLGYACLVFDYRHFGASGGEPRQLLSIPRQHEDWVAAVAYARSLPEVDPEAVVLWGSSLSGGHVLAVAAGDPRVRAVISQVPHVSGYASLRNERLATVARLSLHGLYDSVRGLFGRSPHYVLSSASDGEVGLLNAPGESEGYLGLVPEGVAFDRRVAARFVLNIGLYSPGHALRSLAMPTLVQVGLGDLTTPARPVIEACERAPNATLIQYQAGHFDPFTEPLFTTVARDQLGFLERHVGARARKAGEARLSEGSAEGTVRPPL